MITSLRIFAVILSLTFMATTGYSIEEPENVVDGVFGVAPVEPGSCFAIFVPLQNDRALAGLAWYNNDGSIVFPEVLIASGSAGYPESVSTMMTAATNVNGSTSNWSDLAFSEPVGSLSTGLYVVFRLPPGSEFLHDGYGGGAGVGYTSGANGYTGWFSLDGEEWVKLHSDYGIAVQPVTVPLTEGIALKSVNEQSDEIPVTHTALLLPAPNPFNPQTELHFQLKDACDVDLSIHNIKGERVVRLASGVHSAGRHAVVWRGIDQSGRRLASGTYFVRFTAGPIVQTQRLVLVK